MKKFIDTIRNVKSSPKDIVPKTSVDDISSVTENESKNSELEPLPYYFRDGVRKIHYVIVLHDDQISKEESFGKVLEFLDFLEEQGLNFEFETGLFNPKLLFLKIHATDSVIKHFANLYDVDITTYGHNYIPEDPFIRFNFQSTRLTKNDEDIFKRYANMATSCEILLLLEKLFSDALLSSKEIYSLEKLKYIGYIQDSFPMHDGPWHFKKFAPDVDLNDRQLLKKYWADWDLWFKDQPINLIATYFGTEVAFYFSWVGFYNKMLFFNTVVGVLLIVVRTAWLFSQTPIRVSEVCDTVNIPMCPMGDRKKKQFYPLSYYCSSSKLTFLLSNFDTVLHAILVSLWVTFFLEIWKRKEHLLRVRWNVTYSDVEYKIRYDYQDRTPYLKKSNITGKMEPYVPSTTTVVRYLKSSLILILAVCLISSYVVLLVYVKVKIVQTSKLPPPKPTIISAIVIAILQVFFIKCFSLFYVRLAVYLTWKEVPKTERDYDDGVIYKLYFLSFMNNYIPMFYTAFLRGNFFTVPSVKRTTIFEDDTCLPDGGCLIPLCIQLFFVLILQTTGKNIFTMLKKKVKSKIIKVMEKRRLTDKKAKLPTWEEEYLLERTDKEYFSFGLGDMIIQFGYVTFFLSAFPLAPLCAIINNIFELRSSAINLIKYHRRPVPNMAKNIGAWDDVLRFTAFASIVINGCIVSFTTNVMSQLVYRHSFDGTMKGYINWTLSEFDVTDYEDSFHEKRYNYGNDTICYYTAFRYPPSNEKLKYKLTDDHYLVRIWELLFVIIFEHIMFVMVALLHFFLGEIPTRVKEQLQRERQFTKEVKLKLMSRNMQSDGKSRRISSLMF